jgi:predicted nucleic acid-binding protein
MSLAAESCVNIVLDTNVVLDCFVFRDPGCNGLVAALVDGKLRWIATAAMRDELAHVLARGALDAWKPDGAALWAAWREHCVELSEPPPRGQAGGLRCSDPDDQKFIELAVAAPARWLLSHDRAVLRLARPMMALGIEVVTPAAWSAAQAR